jgi:probable HAF family extracellular repeat protein
MNRYPLRPPIIILLVLLAAFLPVNPAVAAHYTVADLGTLGGSESAAADINDSGQVVGNSYLAGDETWHAFLYSDGLISDLGTLGGRASSASSINKSGQIVGAADLDTGYTHAFLYSNGVMKDLGILQNLSGYASGVDDSGRVVGYMYLPGDWEAKAFIYADSIMTDLGTLGGTESWAYSVNNSGQVVGEAKLADGSNHAFLYADGVMTDLGGTYSCAYGVNDAGQIVGQTEIDGYSRAFLYSDGSIKDLGVLGGYDSSAHGINKYGQVVGWAALENGDYHAFLYADGRMMDLNDLIPQDSGWELNGASAINNKGQIVGYGSINGQTHAFLLTPICAVTLDTMQAVFSSDAGTDKIDVTSVEDCNWTATSSSAWITITAGGSGSGNGTVTYAVAANTDSTSRSGSITIAGQVYTITQTGVKQFTLGVSKTGEGSGVVKSAGSKINCGTICSALFNANTVITLSATPSSGSAFSGWSGGICSGTGACSFGLTADTSVGAAFTTACTYSLESSVAAFGSESGSDSVKIITQTGCKWSASKSLSWITIKSGSSGTGSGTVAYSVSANTGSASRSGSMTVAGNTYSVTQAAKSGGPSGYTFCSNQNERCVFNGALQVAFGASGKFSYKTFTNGADCTTAVFGDPIAGVVKACYTKNPTCTFTISPAAKTYIAAGGSGSVTVTAASGACKRTAASNVAWITIKSGASGTGSGTVTYSVAEHTGTTSRTGTITIGGKIVTITQDPAKQYALIISKSGAGGGTVTGSDGKINCGTICSANYSSGASVTLTATANSGSTFSGWSGGCSGAGNCALTVNTDSAVFASFATTTCNVNMTPTAKTHVGVSDTGSITVAASSGCAWTATSGSEWITITSGGSGIGNGTVNYSVSANTGVSQRTGVIKIGDQTYTVTQTGVTQYTLSLAKAGTGNAVVTSMDAKINCGQTCSVVYTAGTLVTLNIKPDNTSTFKGWSSPCSTATSCTVEMNSDMTITYTVDPCFISISENYYYAAAEGSDGQIWISGSSDYCSWTVATDVPWITIESRSSGTGVAPLSFNIARNKSQFKRTGSIFVGGRTLLVTQLGADFSISINPQNDYALISSSRVTVRGTITAFTDDVGVTVNGIPADIIGSSWVVNNVPLAEGDNTIIAKLTDVYGNTATDSMHIVNYPADSVQLNANITSGMSPLTAYFVARTNIQNQVQLYEMDFLGNGTFVTIGQSFDNVTYTYTAERIYYPALRVTDTAGNVYISKLAITVLSKETLNTLLTKKWVGMKGALKKQDVEGALAYFVSQIKESYRQKFEANKDLVSSVVDTFERFEIVDIVGTRIQYRLYVRKNGDLYRYHGNFIQDENGLWKFIDF